MIFNSSVGSVRCAHPEFCRLHNSIVVARMCLARNSGLRFKDCSTSLSLDFGYQRVRRLNRCLARLAWSAILVVLVDSLLCPLKQLVKITCPEQSVVFDRVSKFGVIALAAPVAQGNAADPQVFRYSVYLQELTQPRHLGIHC